MSSHSEPYANGFGILAGILILWIGTLALVFAVNMFFASGGGGDESGEEESRAGSQEIDIASAGSNTTFRFISSKHAGSLPGLPGLKKI